MGIVASVTGFLYDEGCYLAELSLIVKLPCIWIALATPRVRFLRTAIGWVVVSGLLGLLEFGLISSVLGPPGREAIKVCFALVVGHMAMAAVMIGVLFFLRFFGYFFVSS